jgi:hypothetical protein
MNLEWPYNKNIKPNPKVMMGDIFIANDASSLASSLYMVSLYAFCCSIAVMLAEFDYYVVRLAA